MKKFFMSINLEENSFNIKIFTFILYIRDIIQRIITNGIQSKTILNFFKKEINPVKELLQYNSLNNLIDLDSESIIPDNFGIKKKYDNNAIKINDKDKDKKINEYIIYNKFDSIEFDGRNYVIKNLIDDFMETAYIPLDIIILRNQSLSSFEKNNINFLNVNDNIFNEFKKHFKIFIKSEYIQEALQLNNDYINITKLVKNDNIIIKFLSDKYLKSIPLFEFAGSGYTNKDILISGISGFPFKIYRYKIPKTEKEYKILKGIIILFNIVMKTITILHEIINHFIFGYLNYLTDGKISSKSPKKGSKIQKEDDQLFFEHKLFWYQYGNITLNDVLVILNGDCLDSLKTFQDNLRKEFKPEKFKIKSELLKLIIEEYNITLNDLQNNKNVYSTMKSSESGMYINRDINNIILPFKYPIAYSYNE